MSYVRTFHPVCNDHTRFQVNRPHPSRHELFEIIGNRSGLVGQFNE